MFDKPFLHAVIAVRVEVAVLDSPADKLMTNNIIHKHLLYQYLLASSVVSGMVREVVSSAADCGVERVLAAVA